jgi:CRISPR-associated protein Cas2
MHILVTYDIATADAAGAKRLRSIARTCLNYGQRVQYSVFECTVGDKELVQLRSALLEIINPEVDSLRIYRLHGGPQDAIESHGRDRRIDFEGPLIV